MELTVNEVAKLTGVTVRALHYYDEIGILIPSKVTDAGYRLYDDRNLETLQQILFFREIDFGLKDIKLIISDPDFDKTDALKRHKELLMLKRERLGKLISLVDKTLEGEGNMSFKEFDMTEIEKAQKLYKKEAEEKWGSTEAYKESEQRTAQYGKADWEIISKESEKIYMAFKENMNKEVASPDVQELVAKWQSLISKYFYNCTNEILAGLGQMYVADERFTKNIDKYGDGLAEFMSKSIEYYCKAK